MSRFIIAVEASADLDEIGDYFLDRSVEAGERWFQDFNQKCKYLAQFPSIGRSYSDIRSYLRGVPLSGFIIFYRLKGNGIEIMRIVSGRRNLDEIFSDESME
jgi:toxin ParE1/3/4